MARKGKRGQAKLTRTKVASVENNQSLEELFNIYIFAKTQKVWQNQLSKISNIISKV